MVKHLADTGGTSLLLMLLRLIGALLHSNVALNLSASFKSR